LQEILQVYIVLLCFSAICVFALAEPSVSQKSQTAEAQQQNRGRFGDKDDFCIATDTKLTIEWVAAKESPRQLFIWLIPKVAAKYAVKFSIADKRPVNGKIRAVYR